MAGHRSSRRLAPATDAAPRRPAGLASVGPPVRRRPVLFPDRFFGLFRQRLHSRGLLGGPPADNNMDQWYPKTVLRARFPKAASLRARSWCKASAWFETE